MIEQEAYIIIVSRAHISFLALSREIKIYNIIQINGTLHRYSAYSSSRELLVDLILDVAVNSMMRILLIWDHAQEQDTLKKRYELYFSRDYSYGQIVK